MRFALLLLVALAAVPVLADTADPSPPTSSFVGDDVLITAAAPAPAIDAGDQVIVHDVLDTVVAFITNPVAVGALSIAALIIALLVKLSKLGALARLLERTGKTWIRPLVAAVLGGAGAVVTALSQGVRSPIPLLIAFAAGVYAGFSSSGSVDALRLIFPDQRTKKRVDEGALGEAGAALEDAVVAARVDAGAKVQAARDSIAHTATLPEAKRVEALAAALKAAAR